MAISNKWPVHIAVPVDTFFWWHCLFGLTKFRAKPQIIWSLCMARQSLQVVILRKLVQWDIRILIRLIR